MSLDRLFSESIVNRNDHVVLKQRLKPLSLWHATLLELIDSPLWHGQTAITMADLRLAVSICSESFPTFKRMGYWGRFFWEFRSIGCNLQTEAAKFSAYIRDFHAPPMLWTKDGSEKATSTCPLPHPLDVAAWLIRHNFSEDRAWTMPIGLSQWYYIALAKHRGAEVDLVSPSEQIAIKKVRSKGKQCPAE